jgi:hypothetical protein
VPTHVSACNVFQYGVKRAGTESLKPQNGTCTPGLEIQKEMGAVNCSGDMRKGASSQADQVEVRAGEQFGLKRGRMLLRCVSGMYEMGTAPPMQSFDVVS